MNPIKNSENLLQLKNQEKSDFEEELKKLKELQNNVRHKLTNKKNQIEKNVSAIDSVNPTNILKPVQFFKNHFEIRDLNKQIQKAKIDLKIIEKEYQDNEIKILNLKHLIVETNNDISFISEQKSKGLDIYKDQWVKIEDIPLLKEAELGLTENFSNLSPSDFELFVARLLREMGYSTEVTRKTGDYGVDIIATKNNQRVVIQCKRHKETNKIGNKYIQQLLGSMNYYRADRSIFITTSYFTKQAINQAKNSPIELWDKDTLHGFVKKHLLAYEIDEIFDAIKKEKELKKLKLKEQQENKEKSKIDAKKKREEEKKKRKIKQEEKKEQERRKRICPVCGGLKMKTRRICSRCKRRFQQERAYDEYYYYDDNIFDL